MPRQRQEGSLSPTQGSLAKPFTTAARSSDRRRLIQEVLERSARDREDEAFIRGFFHDGGDNLRARHLRAALRTARREHVATILAPVGAALERREAYAHKQMLVAREALEASRQRQREPRSTRRPVPAQCSRAKRQQTRARRTHSRATQKQSSSADGPPGEPEPRVVFRFDGAAWPNPGPASYGVVIESPEGRLIDRRSASIGHATCNQAEWEAFVQCLVLAKERGVSKVRVVGDSRLVVMQANGRWKVKKSHLKPLHRQAKKLMEEFASVEVLWQPRDQNELADRAAREAR
jgi:ribonuclease HI